MIDLLMQDITNQQHLLGEIPLVTIPFNSFGTNSDRRTNKLFWAPSSIIHEI